MCGAIRCYAISSRPTINEVLAGLKRVWQLHFLANFFDFALYLLVRHCEILLSLLIEERQQVCIQLCKERFAATTHLQNRRKSFLFTFITNSNKLTVRRRSRLCTCAKIGSLCRRQSRMVFLDTLYSRATCDTVSPSCRRRNASILFSILVVASLRGGARLVAASISPFCSAIYV